MDNPTADTEQPIAEDLGTRALATPSGRVDAGQVPPDDRDRFITPSPWVRSSIPSPLHHPWLAELMNDFDAAAYLRRYPDLAAAGFTEEQARNHFAFQGYSERRIYTDRGLDLFHPEFYRALYPELGLVDGHAATVHYLYVGRFEKRFANRETFDAYHARVHVFQMGKVGSKTVDRAIYRATGEPVLHLHSADLWNQENPRVTLRYIDLINHERAEPLRLVSGVRDPISRALSYYFEYQDWANLPRERMTNELAEAEITRTLRNVVDYAVTWFDHGFYSDLSVYDHPFDHARGWSVIDHGPKRLFIYRVEWLARLGDELADFLDIPGLSLQNENEGSAKWYAPFYDHARSNFRVERAMIDRIDATPFARHFFSEEERRGWYERWAR